MAQETAAQRIPTDKQSILFGRYHKLGQRENIRIE
jgi:hypothetical protein